MSVSKLSLGSTNRHAATIIAARCPYCGRDGSFEGAGTDDVMGTNIKDGVNTGYRIGIRRCPRPECFGQLYYQVWGDEVTTFPVQRIDFDTSDVPDNIVKAFEEALSCEASKLHVAAAIMVRKTLELVCTDRQATGTNLSEKIKDLENQVTLPKQLFTAMDNLRLLGNDAAHIESKVFDEIGNDEIVLAIDLTKEILKAIYQLDSIVGRLEALKVKNNATS